MPVCLVSDGVLVCIYDWFEMAAVFFYLVIMLLNSVFHLKKCPHCGEEQTQQGIKTPTTFVSSSEMSYLLPPGFFLLRPLTGFLSPSLFFFPFLPLNLLHLTFVFLLQNIAIVLADRKATKLDRRRASEI